MKPKDIELYKTYELPLDYQSYTIKYQNKYYVISFEEAAFGRCSYGLNTYIWVGRFAGNIKILVESYDFNNMIKDKGQCIKDNYKIWINSFEKISGGK